MRKVEVFHRGWVAVLLAVTMAVGLAGVAAAQTDVTLGRITGTIMDQQSLVLPGVTVEAKNQDTGFTVRAVTDERGFYRVLNLPIGTYSITAKLQGFKEALHPDVRLALGSSPTVDLTLELGAFTETVTVTSEVPQVEVTNTAASTTILTEQIASIPLNGRNFTDLVLATPEARRESERGYLSLSGQRGLATNVMLDGVDFNNAFFGGVTGDAEGRAPLNLSKEAVKEFTVITNGASAEFGRSGGGFVNAVTKSGTNDFHGGAWYYNQPQSMIADFPNHVKPADQSKEQYGADFGGAILKDRLFFFTSYDEQKQDLTIPIDSRVLDPDVFAKWPILASPDQYVQTKDGKTVFGRMDLMLGAGHRLMARANYADFNGLNGTSASTTRTESYNGIEGMFARSYVATWSGVFGENVLNDLNGQYILEDVPRSDKGLGLNGIYFNSPNVRYGEVDFLPIPSSDDRKAIADTVTVTLKDHVLKGGFEYNDTGVSQVFRGNWRGIFIFQNESDFLAGKWMEYRQFGGLNGLTSEQAGTSSFRQKELAFFVNDQWYVSNTLTASFGLRWENLNNPDFGILNMSDQNANGSYNLTSQIPDATNQWSPRIGITWASSKDSVLRFSAGRFYQRTPGLLWAQANTSNGYQGTQYTINRFNMTTGPTDPLSPPWGAGWRPDLLEYIDFTHIPTPKGLGVFTVDPNYKNAYTDRFTVEFEKEIFANTAASIGFTYAKAENLEYIDNVNIQYQCAAGGVGLTCAPKLSTVNGMPLYAQARPNSYYGDIKVISSGVQSKYQGVVFQLNRRFAERFSGGLAVTYSVDKDQDSNERNYSGLQLEDKNSLDNNWGYSVRDQRWKTNLNGTWNTPWWGLVFSGFAYLNTGQPYNVTIGSDANNDADSGTDRPTIGGVHYRRNSGRQPNAYRIDLRLAKNFRLGPGKLGLIAECFNVNNHALYTVSNTTWGSGQTPLATFGTKSLVGAYYPQTFQFSLRYDF
jgi:hypothetical protein